MPFTIYFFCFLIFFSCLSCKSSQKNLEASLYGNWIILYPDHQLRTATEREVYGKFQDSIVALYGLKLITLDENGGFREVDSLLKPTAKWIFTNDSLLKIREGGRGFNPFNTSFKNLKDQTLQLTQFLLLEDEKIKLVWHLKKIEEDNEAAYLFRDSSNQWRNKPASPENEKSIRKRLSTMLNFYGDYFKLVSKEAIYFSPARVPLPFRYYQHAIGMAPKMTPAFQAIFYNQADALHAYSMLEQTIGELGSTFPREENFVAEYGLFLKLMARRINGY